jgi:hypothetical protein
MNPDITNKVQSIGQKYSLHIDEIGFILDEVGAVLSRKTSRDEFIEKLIDRLDTQPTKTVLDIATDISLEVFSAIRNTLKETDIDSTIENKNTAKNISSRDELISAIENPAPSEHPVSIAQPRPVEKTRPSSGVAVAHDFIGEKLSAPVSLPSQKTVVKDEPKKSTPTVDPYREAIN